jgi:hemolysin activation/secretion protein
LAASHSRRRQDTRRHPGLRLPALALLWVALAVNGPRALAQDAAAAERRVQVQRFQVEGATLIPAARIDAALAPLRGARTLAELRQAAEAVQRLYVQAGYGGVVAYLPPQAVQDGTVQIAVIEGKLATVAVAGAKDAAGEARLRATVPALQRGSTPRLAVIDRQLQMANENPSRQVRLLLKPGEQPGQIDAELSLRQRDPMQFTLSADNTGNERTGRSRVGLGWQHADLGGAGDVASLQYQTSPGRMSGVTVVSAAYQRPVPAWLMSWQAYLLYSDVEAASADTAVGTVRISGRGRIGGLRGQWVLPRWGDTDQRFSVTLEGREYRNRCELDSVGSCTGSDTEVLAAPLTLEYAARSVGRVLWSGSLALAHNTGLGGRRADAASFASLRPGAERRFSAVRLAAALGTPGGADWQAQLRLNLQWTADALISGEQFGLGGAASVRGYEERELVGDRGAVLVLEVVSPQWLERATADSPSLRGLLFADGGAVDNQLDAPCRLAFTRCSIAGAGIGLVFELQGLQARLAVARALREGALTARGDARAHASVSYSF